MSSYYEQSVLKAGSKENNRCNSSNTQIHGATGDIEKGREGNVFISQIL